MVQMRRKAEHERATAAAQLLQRAYRGMQGRKEAGRRADDKAHLRNQKATVIQARVRTRLALKGAAGQHMKRKRYNEAASVLQAVLQGNRTRYRVKHQEKLERDGGEDLPEIPQTVFSRRELIQRQMEAQARATEARSSIHCNHCMQCVISWII